MAVENIKNLDELLKPYLGPDKQIIDSKITRLTAAGENYGSVILGLDLKIKDSHGKIDHRHAVAKLLPSTEMFREIFNVQVTFKNEKGFYDTIVPTLREFQKEQGVSDVIDCFAEFYGARINLNPGSEVVDDDAVLVVENLKTAGFVNIDRYEGFTLDGAKVVLRDLAKFHGVPLALKLTKPKVFEEKIKPYLVDFKVTSLDFIKEVLQTIASEDEECLPLIPKISVWDEKPLSTPREPFATIGHCDLWTNNTMQKFENGKIVDNKIVDFQGIAYRSPAADVFFLLWTSLPKKVLEEHLSDLLKYYHDCLIDTLKQHKCDIAPFSFDNFMKELETEAEYEFGHAFQFLVMVVHFKKGSYKEGTVPTKEVFLKNVTEAAKENVQFMLKECHKRGWLY